MMKNKKGAIEILYHWPQLCLALFFVVGILLAMMLRSAIVNYIVVGAAGFMSGLIFHDTKKGGGSFPIYMIVFGFIAGYTIGTYYASRILVLIIFFVASNGAQTLKKKGLIG